MIVKINQQSHKSQGQTQVTVTSAPLTKIGATSSANTTFTTTNVTDGTAWTLTAVLRGDTAVSSDGCRGIVQSAGSNIVTVNNWYDGAGNPKTPTNGSTVTIHRLGYVKKLLIRADKDNAADLYVAQQGTALNTDFLMTASQELVLEAGFGQEWIDVTKIQVLAASDTQLLTWIDGGSS